MSNPITINKNLQLPVAKDYYQLRKKATDSLQNVATENWTDFNLHDPGITLEELFAYGITDLGYRQNLPIENLLTVDLNNGINNEIQALYTPNEILTINPYTINDYRKLLIDIPGVKNAWLSVACNIPDSCGVPLYVNCKDSILVYEPTEINKVGPPTQNPPIQYQGLYNVLVELEDDTTLGNLNSGSIIYRFTFPEAGLGGGLSNSSSSSSMNNGNNGQQSITTDIVWYNAFIEIRLPSFEDISGNGLYTDLFGKSPGDIFQIIGPGNQATAGVTFTSVGEVGDTVSLSVGGISLLATPYTVQSTDVDTKTLVAHIAPLIQGAFTGTANGSELIVTAAIPSDALNNYTLQVSVVAAPGNLNPVAVIPVSAQFSGGTAAQVTFYQDAACTLQVFDANFQAAAQSIMYTTFVILYGGNDPNLQAPIVMKGVPVKIYFYESGGRQNLTLHSLQEALEDASSAGVASLYMNKLQTAGKVMANVMDALHSHRNIGEDFCTVTTAFTEDFAICCDIDAATDVDLEQIQAQIYYQVIRYMNPPLNFYTWEELNDKGYTIDQIFNGPRVNSGFITDDDLNNSGVKTELYTADIIDLILNNVSGVIAVRNFAISRIGPAGNVLETQAWKIAVTPGFLPEFYLYGSSIQFYKNSLPFTTDFFELSDSLALLIASNEKPKLTQYEIDVPVPVGSYVNLKSYYPLMYSLPPVYNVSEAGPMPPFSPERYAQAKQLQAYLLFYEQINANWIEQIGDLKNFFNVEDPDLPTYPSYVVGDNDIPGVSDLFDNTSTYTQHIRDINEKPLSKDFYVRKNRIYNHLLARFGENNQDYLLINNTVTSPLLQPDSDVINEKARLILEYPNSSYNKARAMNYLKDKTPIDDSFSEGLIAKLRVLLGMKNWDDYFLWRDSDDLNQGTHQLVLDFNSIRGPRIVFKIYDSFIDYPAKFSLDSYLPTVFYGITTMLNSDFGEGLKLIDGAYYLMGGTGEGAQFVEICRIDAVFPTPAAAYPVLASAGQFIISFLVQTLFVPIEHILLRPKTQNEPCLNICIDDNCQFCGNEDPYSFRVTIIICGDNGFPGYNLAYRAYAEDLIRSELPAHVLAKVCWISASDFGDILSYFTTYLTIMHDSLKTDTDIAEARGALVSVLNNMRSMYPPATLADCGNQAGAGMVILGKTVIQ